MTIKRPPAIVINDSTLRDVERMRPLTFFQQNKIDIAQGLEKVGVGEIELAMPSSRGTEIDDLSAIAAVLSRAKPILWGPASRHTVDAAARSGLGSVTLSVKLSARYAGRTAVLDRLTRIIIHARERGLTVGLCGDDASRADFDLIRAVIAAAEAAGASRFRFTDTMGVLHPIRTHALFRQLCAETDLELEFRGHDDFGLATANTLAAVEGGATHVSVSLVRRAEHSHAAQLEDVVGAIRISTMHPVNVDLTRIPPLASLVAVALGRPLPSRHRHPGRSPVPQGAVTMDFGVTQGMEGR